MKYIRIEGINGNGETSKMDYSYPGTDNDMEAIAITLKYANREYTYTHDDGITCPTGMVKTFAQITKVEVVA